VGARADDLGWSDWGTPEAIERTFAAMGMVPPWHRLPIGRAKPFPSAWTQSA
jgi:hypothetical protein